MTTPPRTYLGGLPVEITVHDDGRVTFDVDVADAADAPAEYDPEYMPMFDATGVAFVPSDEVLDADAARITAALEHPWVRTPH